MTAREMKAHLIKSALRNFSGLLHFRKHADGALRGEQGSIADQRGPKSCIAMFSDHCVVGNPAVDYSIDEDRSTLTTWTSLQHLIFVSLHGF